MNRLERQKFGQEKRGEDSEQSVEKEALDSLAERLRLKEQYLAQVKVLYQSGILENFAPTPERPLPEMGIIGIDGKEYVLPSYEDILDRLKDPETRKSIEQKMEQGFTRLQITPFALPLSVLIDRYKQVLLKINKETGIQATDGSKLELDPDNPVYVWEDLTQCDNPDTPNNKQMEYNVTNYEGQTKQQRKGQYKSELLQNPDNAWQLSLVEDNPDLPAENKGKTISGRRQIEVNKTPVEYLKLFHGAGPGSPYEGESGQTPESALTTQLTYLQEKHIAIDDWQGQGKINWLVGNYLSGRVPKVNWDRGARRADLGRSDPGVQDSGGGFRSAARF